MRKDTIADEATELVFGDRQRSYSSPLTDYSATAKIVSALLRDKLKEDLTAEDCALIMVAVKLSRFSRNRTHRDSLVDANGYLLCIEHIQRELEEIENGSKKKTISSKARKA